VGPLETHNYRAVVAAPENSAALCELLDDELSYDATTSTRLSNHLPMALVALDRLGAPPGRLSEFATRYRTRLVPVNDDEPVRDFDGWLAARGRPGSYGQLRPYLDGAVADDGVDAVLATHLPHLVDGVGGAAFHGIIRLAYALESRSDARVAAGLAYLTQVHQPLGRRGSGEPWTDDPLAALSRVRELKALAATARRGNIGARMAAVGAHREFDGVVDWLAVTTSTPERLTAAAVALYATTDDFTALHGVTASHALLTVAPYVADTEALCAYWFQALAAAYVTIGAPSVAEPTVGLEPWLEAPVPFDAIAGPACASDDEHVIKLVYSARQLHERSGDPVLVAVAARQAGIQPIS
jgi:hypothetical protein